MREVREELGCTVGVTRWLDAEAPISEELVLRVALATILDGAPEPTEHDAVRWLAAAELDDVDWLDPDRPFLAEIAASLVEEGRQARHETPKPPTVSRDGCQRNLLDQRGGAPAYARTRDVHS